MEIWRDRRSYFGVASAAPDRRNGLNPTPMATSACGMYRRDTCCVDARRSSESSTRRIRSVVIRLGPPGHGLGFGSRTHTAGFPKGSQVVARVCVSCAGLPAAPPWRSPDDPQSPGRRGRFSPFSVPNGNAHWVTKMGTVAIPRSQSRADQKVRCHWGRTYGGLSLCRRPCLIGRRRTGRLALGCLVCVTLRPMPPDRQRSGSGGVSVRGWASVGTVEWVGIRQFLRGYIES